MCLLISKRRTQELNNIFTTKNSIICYKVINKHNNRLYSNTYSSFMWKNGWNISDREQKELEYTEKYDGCIYNGIHVFHNLHTAMRNRACYEIVIPVRCYRKDFIKAGYMGHAAFMKVFLTKKDYLQALK